jgi:hypothetical protein
MSQPPNVQQPYEQQTNVPQPGPQMPVQQPYVASVAPIAQLKTNRSLLRFILFTIITLGIYSIVFFYTLSSDLNIIASRYDGKRTMNYALLFFLIGPITGGIAVFVWYHKICGRIGAELRRRGVDYSFGASSFWLWMLLGSFIVVGPFVFLHKLSTASNKLAEHFNTYG